MDYLTVKEAAEKWGLGTRVVNLYCVENRITGVVKRGNLWLIPANAERPVDKRRRSQALPEPEQALSLFADLSDIFTSTTVPMSGDNPDAILSMMDEDRLRLIYEAELAYLRGDFTRTIDCYQQTSGDDAARLRICLEAIAAAISIGDYHAYTEIDAYLKRTIKINMDGRIKAVAEFSLAVAAVSMNVLSMVPDWLREGDLSSIPPIARHHALYLRAKYFQRLGQFDAMLTVAQTTLTLSSPEQGITATDLYLRLTCAVACHELRREEEAKLWLLSAMRLALPHGLITPFAELIAALGGLMEKCLEQEFPGCYDAVIEQWERTWKNWMTFRNRFTKDNITLILSLREYHFATLVVRHVPLAQIAKQHHISVSRLKGIMRDIYGKLFITSQSELGKFIL